MRNVLRLRPYIAILCAQALLFTLVGPRVALAQHRTSLSWDNVLKLGKGDSISVRLFSKQLYRGKVEKVEPSGIYLTAKERSLHVPKVDIQSVGYVGRPKVARPGAWMIVGGIGLTAAGAVAGTAKDLGDIRSARLSGSTGKRGIGLMIAGLAIAAAGVPLLFVGGKVQTIYEAKTAQPATAQD